MANYRISGACKDKNGTITDYLFHEFDSNGNQINVSSVNKNDAIRIVRNNDVKVWVWNCKNSSWISGMQVTVVDGNYLRSTADKTAIDNLDNLINYSTKLK